MERVKAVPNSVGNSALQSHRFLLWLAGLVVCVVTVVLCYLYVDRPVAEYFEATVRYTETWQWLSHLLTLFPLTVGAAMVFLFYAGCKVMARQRLPFWSGTPLACSWAAMWALATERILKGIFGRPGPEPLYLHHNVYGFEGPRGNLRWDSFPSGTALVITAVAAVVWILQPKWRWAGTLMSVILMCAVIAANWHWVSDVVAGAYLGATIGWMTVYIPVEVRSTLVRAQVRK